MRPTARWMTGVWILALAIGLAKPAHAQDSVMVIDPDAPLADSSALGALPASVVRELLATWNDSTTTRLNGPVALPAGSRLQGRVALYRGVLRVAGTIDGPVTIINGNLVLLPGGIVRGDVLVVGGRIVKQDGSTLDGSERVYWDLAPLARQRDGSLVIQETPNFEALGRAEASFAVGSVRTTVHASGGGTYNRIEGFPLAVGPTFDWRPSRMQRAELDLTGIVRTSSDRTSSHSDFGYRARAEWRRLGEITYGLGARARAVVEAIPEPTLSRAESGWSSLLVQDDQYDYYYSQLFGVYGFLIPARQFRVDLSWDSDRQRSSLSNNPWSILVNDARWRPNPLVDDGRYDLFTGAVTLDTRDSERQPTTGWYAQGRLEYGRSGNVAPLALPPDIRDPIPTSGAYHYTTLRLDARRYVRLSPEDRLSGRAYFEGWIGGDELPMQRRLSLGGPGIVPGNGFRQANCTPPTVPNPSQASFCTRTMFFQVEYRHRLNLGWHYTIDRGEDGTASRIIGIQSADLVLFSDLGTAWLSGVGPNRVPNNRLPSLGLWQADVGAGIDFGFLGAYLAKSINGEGPLRLSLRLQRRF